MANFAILPVSIRKSLVLSEEAIMAINILHPTNKNH
jgi:hypothetical protein